MAFTIENSSIGASLTNVTISRSYITSDETFDLSFTIKVSSSSSAKAIAGDVIVGLSYGTNIHTLKVYNGISIAKGKSKTFSETYTFPLNNKDLDGENVNIIITAAPSTGDAWHVLRIKNAFTYIYQRVAPELLNIRITDGNDLHDQYSAYAKDYSALTCIGNVQLDPQDPTLTATYHLKVVGEDTVLFEGSSIESTIFIGTLSYSGVVQCIYTVRDSAGNTSQEGYDIFVVRDYLPPSFMLVDGSRCITTYDDAGNIIVESSITGTQVAFGVSYRVENMQIENGTGVFVNGYSLTLRYAGSDGSAGMADITDLADGSYYPMLNFVSNGESVFPNTDFNEGIDYTFEIEIADEFTEVTHQIYISRSTGVFNIEKNGVAIGMISTATDSQKKFEVHEDYETHLYGDAYCYAGIKTFGGGEFCTQSQAALGIQSGALGNVGGQAGGTCSDHEVTFLTPFAEGTVPVVVVSFRTSSSEPTFGNCTCSVHSKTNAGFTIRFYNGDTSKRSPGFDWIAIGQVAAVEDEPETETTATTSLLGEAVLGEMVLGEG